MQFSQAFDQNKRNGNYSVDLVTVKSFPFNFKFPWFRVNNDKFCYNHYFSAWFRFFLLFCFVLLTIFCKAFCGISWCCMWKCFAVNRTTFGSPAAHGDQWLLSRKEARASSSPLPLPPSCLPSPPTPLLLFFCYFLILRAPTNHSCHTTL